MRWHVLFLFLALIAAQTAASKKYQPNWKSIDSRPLPSWYDEAKIGIFMHWGVFSVPSYASEWFWELWRSSKNPSVVKFMKDNYPPGFTYPDFGRQFKTELFEPDYWADIFQDSGARYVVLTSKHHEGYTNWPSKYSWNWNSKSVGPNRDLVGELATSIRKRTKIHFGIYHSLFEWYHPLYLEDVKNKHKTQYFVKQKTMPELYELVNTYKPEVIWSDGDWNDPYTYWNSTNFLAWLYNDSPVRDTIVVNDRWGSGMLCHHGGYYTCQDRYNPRTLQNHKWENAMTLDKKSWGYRREAVLGDYLSTDELITTLAETISCGGNLLINIGPTKEGTIMALFEERLRQLGSWLKVNGEGVYGSKPWIHQNDTVTKDIWYTTKDKKVYVFVLDWPKGNVLHLGAVNPTKKITVELLGYKADSIQYKSSNADGIMVIFPSLTPDTIPCQWAWVLRITGL